MLRLESITDLRRTCDDARSRKLTVGVVPTMGYLHAGHLSLVERARSETDFVVVTIFVNPLQFGPTEDLERYPRDLDRDLQLCADAGVDCVFAPSVEEMYPRPIATTVHVAGLTEGLCGAARPTHFDGVTTVVTKLFAIAGPCRAYFGRKDAQQLAVVRRMVDDLNLPVDVVGGTLVREPDGLALSSRNAYLTPAERRAAPVLARALQEAADAIAGGVRDPVRVAGLVTDAIATEPAVTLEYVEVRGAHDLQPLERLEGEVLIAVAARLGSTRLIDNVGVTIEGAEVTADLGRRLGG